MTSAHSCRLSTLWLTAIGLRKESSSIYDGFRTLESTNWLILKKPGCKQWLQAVTSPEISAAARARGRLAHDMLARGSLMHARARASYSTPYLLWRLYGGSPTEVAVCSARMLISSPCEHHELQTQSAPLSPHCGAASKLYCSGIPGIVRWYGL